MKETLHINDIVIHNRDGVCRITGTTELSLSDQIIPVKYYVLVPEYDRDTKIYVPVETAGSTIRPLLSENEVKSLIREIPDMDAGWIENEKVRQQTYEQIIAGGDHRELLGIIGALYHNRTEKEKRGRKFHSSDERLLNEAQKVLFQEFAFVLKIQPSEVPSYIRKTLDDPEASDQ